MVKLQSWTAQSVGVVEYTDCISVEEYAPSPQFGVLDIKQSDDGAPVMLELWGIAKYPFIAIAFQFTLAWSGSILYIDKIELFDI